MKREWYSHLRSNEFEDIEKRDRYSHDRSTDLSYRKDFHTKDQFEAKQSYFVWAEQMLYLGCFKSLTDEKIWEYHSENLSRRKIAERVGLNDRWCSRKIAQIREYLTIAMSSQSAVYC